MRLGAEYEAGHIPGAVSIPIDELPARLAGLPREPDIVAYCRGPYCVMALQGVDLLRAHGLPARRLEDGLPEWRLAGYPVAVGLDERRSLPTARMPMPVASAAARMKLGSAWA